MNRQIAVIAHDLRSAHNVGSLLRTADGLGVETVYLTGYTPYPAGGPQDERLPHEAKKVQRAIQKTALGAETSQRWVHQTEVSAVLAELQSAGYFLVALEQTANSQLLPHLQLPKKVAFVLGREVEGLATDIIAQCNTTAEIPMQGKKESFNVTLAAAMALYQARYF